MGVIYVVSHCGFARHLCDGVTEPSDVKHLFLGLLTTYVSSVGKCLFKPFSHFEMGGGFLLWTCSSLYILDINSTLDTWFAFFSHSLG